MQTNTIGILVARLLCLALVGCVSHPVAQCIPGFIEKPPITRECREQPGSMRYMEKATERFSARLDSWRTYPGRLDLSVAFAHDASIESVCLRQNRGSIVEQRAPRAVRAFRGVRGVPACFANRRIEIEWASAIITEEELRVALTLCGAKSTAPRPLRSCPPPCGVEQRARITGADERVFTCMLKQLPLAFSWEGGDQLITFLPHRSATPSPERAFAAAEACDGLADRAAVVACMSEMEWEVVDWDLTRQSLID